MKNLEMCLTQKHNHHCLTPHILHGGSVCIHDVYCDLCHDLCHDIVYNHGPFHDHSLYHDFLFPLLLEPRFLIGPLSHSLSC